MVLPLECGLLPVDMRPRHPQNLERRKASGLSVSIQRRGMASKAVHWTMQLDQAATAKGY